MNKIVENIKKYDILILVIIGILLYFPSLFYDILSYDDMPFIIKNEYLNGLKHISFYQFFIPNYIVESIYTPFTFIIYWLILKIFGTNAFAFHFVNIFFYLSSSIVLFYLLKKIINNYFVVFFAVILYILHPCHIESTVWISAMGYNIATLFFLLSFLFFISAFDKNKKLYYVYSIISYILSILSQPISVTLPAILFLWVFCFRKERFKESIKYICAYIPFLFVYLYLYSQTILKTFRFNLKDFSILEKFSISGFYLFNSFIPINLCPIQPIPNLCFIISLLIFLLFVYLFRKNNIFIFFVCLGLITIFPYLNILFSMEIPIADRYLNLSSVSSCVLISYFSFYIFDKFKEKKIIKYIAFIFFVLLFLCSFLFYIPIWKNDKILWIYSYNVNPNNIIVSDSFGKLLIKEKKYDEAIILSEKMIKENPLFYEGYELKIKALILENKWKEALNFSLKVKDTFSRNFYTYLYLFDIYISLQDYEEAEKNLNIAEDVCKKYWGLKHEKVDFFSYRKLTLDYVFSKPDEFIENLKIISNNFKLLSDDDFLEILNKHDYNSREEICLNYLKKYNNDYSRYVIMLLNCLCMRDNYKDNTPKEMKIILNNMIKSQEFINKKDYDSAEKIYLDIISKNKYMYEAYYNLGFLYLQTNRQNKAKEIFEKMLKINPNDEQIKQLLNNLGENIKK